MAKHTDIAAEASNSEPCALVSVVMLWSASIAASACGFLTQVILARSLSVLEFGTIGTALATITLFYPVAGCGIGGLWLRVFGEEGRDGRRWISPSMKLAGIASLVSMALLMVWGRVGGGAREIRFAMNLLLPLLPIQAITELTHARFKLEGRYGALSFWQLYVHGGRFLVATLSWFYNLDLIGVLTGYLMVSVAMASVFVVQWIKSSGRITSVVLRKSRPTVRSVLSASWPYAISSVFYLVYFQSDIILLGWLLGSETAAIYSVAVSVITVAYLWPSVVFQQYLMPKLHRWAEYDFTLFLQGYRFGNGIMIITGTLFSIVFLCLGPVIIPLVFGAQYGATVPLLQVLALCIPIRYLAVNAGTALVATKNVTMKVTVQGIGALLNLLINIVLIRSMGARGAAVSTLITEFTVLFLYHFCIRRQVFRAGGWREFRFLPEKDLRKAIFEKS